MTRARPSDRRASVVWLPRLARRGGPRYRAIADALEADVRAGRLAPGDALPTHRELADHLGVNFTTITRAYTEARRRGLITATVGRGTFVADASAQLRDATARPTEDYDLSVNAPPMPGWLSSALHETIARLGAEPSFAHGALSYEGRLGDASAREAGVTWLGDRGLDADPSRVVVTAGAQHALALLLSTITRPNDTVLVESLSYPGLHGAAAMAGVRLVGVDIDHEGLRPDALDACCERFEPKAIFCVPTLHNPTVATMSPRRREEIIAIARQHGVRVVEDDIYGPLQPEARPLAALAPDFVIHIASLSKCVAPGLRTAFVLTPTADEASRLTATLRASVLMLSPLPLLVASSWIDDGTAHRAVADIRREAASRNALAQHILGADRLLTAPASLHAWLRLPPTWSLAGFVAHAQQNGVRVAPADWYVTPSASAETTTAPNAVRLTLGAEPDRARLEHALKLLASILDQPVGLRASNL
jgi:DNA-binding transcriptional MocR family regulator